jgi:hypothetical protein
MWRGDKQYLTIYEDDATNANTIEDESLAVLKAVDDLDLRPTTLSANFTDRPACVINFLGLGCTIIKRGFLVHLSLTTKYHQRYDGVTVRNEAT